MHRLVALAIALAHATLASAGQQSLSFDDHSQPIALVIRYADGRVVRRNVGPSARSWTPMFPRVPGWAEPSGGLPVEALQYAGTRTSAGFRMTISVLRGKQHQQESQIASVVLTGPTPVAITALSAVGVMPIELWVEPGERVSVYAAPVENRTAGLEISAVDVTDGPLAGLVITVRNVSSRDALSYNFETLGPGRRPGLSGRQADPSGVPIIAAGGEHTFRLSLSGTTPLNQPEVLVLDGVQWMDGSFEGDPRAAAFQWCRDSASRVQVQRIITMLRESAADPGFAWSSLRSRADALAIVATGAMLADAGTRLPEPRPVTDGEANEVIAAWLQVVKKRFIDEIDSARAASRDAARARAWLDAAHTRYTAQLSRLVAR